MDGKRIKDYDERSYVSVTGYVLQSLPFPNLTVAEKYRSFLRWRAGTKERVASKTLNFEKVGLPASDYADRKPMSCLVGSNNGLAWLWAINGEPKILLMDEPLFSLGCHPGNSYRLYQRLAQEFGRPLYLCYTYDTDEALKLGDRIAGARKERLCRWRDPRPL